MTSSETRAHALIVRAQALYREKVPPGDVRWRHLLREATGLPEKRDRSLVYYHLAFLWYDKQ